MTDTFPDKARPNPVTLPDGSVHPGTVFLSKIITHPNWHVGDYTYASDFSPPEDWATHLAPYLFPGGRENLYIGKFCQIAHGVRFITSGANHAQTGLTTFPFPIFDPDRITRYQPDMRDTQIGHDVWIGYDAIICPGAKIGNGAIIGARSVIRGTIPPYAIVIGNPGRVVRQRFDDKTTQSLQDLAWWDWPAEHIANAWPALEIGDLDRLKTLRP